MLSEKEKYRYDRHLRLAEIGADGQEKLKASAVLIVGAGGLGSPALQYLAAAGIGHVGVIDHDVVDESNLQRQVLFNTDDLGHNKAAAARDHLEKLNPLIQVTALEEKLTPKNALDILDGFDLVLDCTDNFAARYLLNDATIILSKPLIYGAIYKFEGQVSVFNYQNGPSYRCLFPYPPEGEMPSCAEIGVLGVLPGLVGILQANEAMKLILGIGDVLSGKMLIYNSLQAGFSRIHVPRNDQVIEKVKQEAENFTNSNYEAFCRTEPAAMREVSLEEFKRYLKNGSTPILDVREPWESPKLEGDYILQIPLSKLLDEVEAIPRSEDVIVACQHGIRSKSVVEYLSTNHNFKNLINLKGGLTPHD